IKLSIDIGAVVSIATIDGDAREAGPKSGTIRITRAGQITTALTVNYTIGGNATNGNDYQTIASSVSFAANETQKDILITPIDDNVQEGPETVTLTLQSSANYFLGQVTSAAVTITDNEFPVNDNF